MQPVHGFCRFELRFIEHYFVVFNGQEVQDVATAHHYVFRILNCFLGLRARLLGERAESLMQRRDDVMALLASRASL